MVNMCLNIKKLFSFSISLIIFLIFIYLGCARSQLQHTGSSSWSAQLPHAGSLVAACGLLSCSMQTLSCGTRTLSCSVRTLSCGMQTPCCGMHVGSSSQTRARTQAPCTGSADSYPVDHQGSPLFNYLEERQQQNIMEFIIHIEVKCITTAQRIESGNEMYCYKILILNEK